MRKRLEWRNGSKHIVRDDSDAANMNPPDTAKGVQQRRRKAYEEESDPLFFEQARGEIPRKAWLAKVAEIKQRFPMPDQE